MKNLSISIVAEGLDFPTSLAFDEEGTPWIAESGLPFAGAAPGGRIRRVDRDGRTEPLLGDLRSPVNGLCFHDGAFFISEGGNPGRISRWAPGRKISKRSSTACPVWATTTPTWPPWGRTAGSISPRERSPTAA